METGKPPAGFHSLTPRIVVADVPAMVDFLRAVFGATGDAPAGRPAEIRIGDSLIMVTAADERELFPAFLYVYVDNADDTYRRAVGAGAETIEPPLDTPTATGGRWSETPSATSFRLHTGSSRRRQRARPAEAEVTSGFLLRPGSGF
jgi:PhnB protein